MPYDLRIGERCVILPTSGSDCPECTGHHCTVDQPLGNHFGFTRDGDVATPAFLSYGVACECGNELYCAPTELRRVDPPCERPSAMVADEVPA